MHSVKMDVHFFFTLPITLAIQVKELPPVREREKTPPTPVIPTSVTVDSTGGSGSALDTGES